ncbi:LysR family transcriptional regulator [Ewingella americana]|uniref:D-malate degradation protein R n=2 Tax=Ewingella americana TaxID=41202 RepID=A0A377N837_9GAMM|nr:LysR family transcriptional regulator [Ewingella americana]KAA8727531.1 LysR family transcriptional regulator [Ewingella americana]KFC79440.1 putative transcriptional regulator [Ewingella americana ATCC 33852]STQ42802.1 D-malate degradation protein R [Ewingella americana]
MDKLDSMRLFTRVVELRSFTQAAQDLDLKRSTVTDAIKQLEQRLNVRLLQRTTRHVSATLDGEAYYQRCLRILADVEEAEMAFAGAQPKGILRVDVHGTMARYFVLPGLPDFLARYPDIEMVLSEGDRLVDLVREGIDCVIRAGELKDSDMVARSLGQLEEITCASPDYLQRVGTPKMLEDLQGHQMIGYRSTATGGLLPLVFNVEGKVRSVTLPTTLSVTGAESMKEAARRGLGIIQVPKYGLTEDLQSGALVQLLPQFSPGSMQVSLLYPRNRQLSPRVRVFIDWIVKEFAARNQ